MLPTNKLLLFTMVQDEQKMRKDELRLQRDVYLLDKLYDLISERQKSIITVLSLLAAIIGLASFNKELLPIPTEILRLILIKH